MKKDINELTVKELRKMAQGLKIKGYKNMRKAQLVEEIMVAAIKAGAVKEVVEEEPVQVVENEVKEEVEVKEEQPVEIEEVKEEEVKEVKEDEKELEVELKTMVMLKSHTKTYRYRYLLTVFANQMGIRLDVNPDGTVTAKGTEEQLTNLSIKFGKFTDLINKTRIAQWRKAKKENTLVPNLERSLILGMLHSIREKGEFLTRNSNMEKTLKRNIHKNELVEKWYIKGKEIINKLQK